MAQRCVHFISLHALSTNTEQHLEAEVPVGAEIQTSIFGNYKHIEFSILMLDMNSKMLPTTTRDIAIEARQSRNEGHI